MGHAVSFVQAYLRINGFLTVTEYPILHRSKTGTFREVTDVDILALRLPGAGRVLPRPRPTQGQKLDLDPVLGLDYKRREFIIGEVKEGEANPNRVLLHRGVLHESLRRFGCGSRGEQAHVVRVLQKEGTAILEDGSRVRLVLFGSRPGKLMAPCQFLSLGHVVDFLKKYLHASRVVHGYMHFRDPALSVLTLLDKAESKEETEET